MTSNRGLLPSQTVVTLEDLRRLAQTDIDDVDFRIPRTAGADVHLLSDQLPADAKVVLLGSIATGKYCNVLLEILGDRLQFPREFIGRGDMSRGGLLLRCVDQNQELEYIPVACASSRCAAPENCQNVDGLAMTLAVKSPLPPMEATASMTYPKARGGSTNRNGTVSAAWRSATAEHRAAIEIGAASRPLLPRSRRRAP